MIKPYRAYLFDLDGTLVDTAPDIHQALNYALQQHGLSEVDIALTRHWVGHGSRVLVERALTYHQKSVDIQNRAEPAIQASIDPQAIQQSFIDYYQANLVTHSNIYPDVEGTLEALKAQGAKLAVVTNKLTQLSTPLLEQIGLAPLFDLVVCGDTAAHPKPAADPINLCLAHFVMDHQQTLMVGDSGTDVDAARAANVDVACVSDGYNHGVDVASLNPDYVLSAFTDLLTHA